jgi:hypothetical protein
MTKEEILKELEIEEFHSGACAKEWLPNPSGGSPIREKPGTSLEMP